MIDFRTAAKGRRILLCEADPRIVKAAHQLLEEGIVTPILVGETDSFHHIAQAADVSLEGIEIRAIEPAKYADKYHELRKHKGISKEDAEKALADPAFYCTMLLDAKEADGLVCGASWPTANTLRPALQILREGLVSSYFVMRHEKGDYVFSDCALNVQPTAEQLGQIAFLAGKEAERLGLPVRIALLSFSTVGSASHPDQEKVMHATELARKLVADAGKDWKVGGELQLDAAIVPAVGKSKAPDSPVQGDATVLVFPDLDAGNIGYKLVQRFGGAQAIGPILTSLRRPVSDLSRGCSAQDVVEVAYVTAWQATRNA